MIANHKKSLALLLATVVSLAGVLALSPQATASFDLIIAGGRIVDGTGAPGFVGDVGIVGDGISALGHLADARAVRRIDD